MRNISLVKYVFFIYVYFLNNTGLPADPPRNILQENAIKINPVYFHTEDDFILLGEIAINTENVIIIAHNKCFWGNGRMTGRILIFNSFFQLIGMYGTISDTPRIEGKMLIFPFPENIGNTVDFSSGIPSMIWVDGEVYRYESVAVGN